jgi:hypothetical protein
MGALLLTMLFIGILLAVTGYYRSRLDALTRNPVTRVRIIPRTMYDDVTGVDWVTE